MKKINWGKWKLRTVKVEEIGDRALLVNLYATQLITLTIGIVIVLLQGRNPAALLLWPDSHTPLLWGAGFAAAVLAADLAVSRWVPADVTDDGGINERLFGGRAIWHIALISFIVAVCEEMLFRGAVQHAIGSYWTSILFAAIHVRYLRHWLMTGIVFSISYGLGWIYEHTGTLWAPIAAHFVIDLVMGCIIKWKGRAED